MNSTKHYHRRSTLLSTRSSYGIDKYVRETTLQNRITKYLKNEEQKEENNEWLFVR